MRTATKVAVALALSWIPAAFAQNTSTPATTAATAPTATEATAPNQPALIRTDLPSATDSSLVRAAKASLAARRASAARSTGVVINDANMPKRGTISFATGEPASRVASTTPAGTAGAATTMNPRAMPSDPAARAAAAEKKVRNLRVEEGRAQEEMEQPYGGEMSEDQAVQRATQIPAEIKKTEDDARKQP